MRPCESNHHAKIAKRNAPHLNSTVGPQSLLRIVPSAVLLLLESLFFFLPPSKFRDISLQRVFFGFLIFLEWVSLGHPCNRLWHVPIFWVDLLNCQSPQNLSTLDDSSSARKACKPETRHPELLKPAALTRGIWGNG